MAEARQSGQVNKTHRLAGGSDSDHVIAAIADINGVWRGKRLPTGLIDKAMQGGLRMPLSTLVVDIWGRDVLASGQVFETGDSDGIVAPTERGLLPVSWMERPTGFLPLWMANEDGSPYAGDPRRALAAIVDRFHAHGLRPVTATELEFYLVDPKKHRARPPKSPVSGKRLAFEDVLSADELDAFDGFLADVYAASALQGIPAEAAISEGGCGQFEVNLQHTNDPLRTADDAVLFKRLVKGVARRHGLAASFMAKPYGEDAGNGFHIHFSLVDENGRNVFDDGSAEGSSVLKHAVGGLLAAMDQSMLLFAPHQNSYRRLREGTHAPVARAWGYENRTAAIRIPGGSPKARRIEHRVAGADTNPYLVLTAMLGGALIGIERHIAPDQPITGNAYAESLPLLPTDWNSALKTFEQGALIGEILDPALTGMIAACKRQEMARFAAEVTALEYQSYLDVV